jgi:hypothetical protein
MATEVIDEVGVGTCCSGAVCTCVDCTCSSFLSTPLDDAIATDLAAGFAALADPARLRLVLSLIHILTLPTTSRV